MSVSSIDAEFENNVTIFKSVTAFNEVQDGDRRIRDLLGNKIIAEFHARKSNTKSLQGCNTRICNLDSA